MNETKYSFTERIWTEHKGLANSHWKNQPLDTALSQWWVSGRSGNGLRLTLAGLNAIRALNIEEYSIPLYNGVDPPTFGFFLMINKYVTCPYYIKDNMAAAASIIIFDSKLATLCLLYGSVIDYINTQKRNE